MRAAPSLLPEALCSSASWHAHVSGCLSSGRCAHSLVASLIFSPHPRICIEGRVNIWKRDKIVQPNFDSDRGVAPPLSLAKSRFRKTPPNDGGIHARSRRNRYWGEGIEETSQNMVGITRTSHLEQQLSPRTESCVSMPRHHCRRDQRFLHRIAARADLAQSGAHDERI